MFPARQRSQLRLPLRSALTLVVAMLAGVAVIAGGILVAGGIAPHLIEVNHRLISAAPLLAIGSAYLILQVLVRQRLTEFIRRLMVVSAFIFWGIDQLLPPSLLARTLGDLVILLYVVDLALVVKEQLAGFFEPPAPPLLTGNPQPFSNGRRPPGGLR